jgi:hypothetical protein
LYVHKKNNQVAVQRTLVTDPILLRHQKEQERKRREAGKRVNQHHKNKNGNDDSTTYRQDEITTTDSLSSSLPHMSTMSNNVHTQGNVIVKERENSESFATGAHSKEGDLAIRRARELTAMALAQL